jgi:hypothetical protein
MFIPSNILIPSDYTTQEIAIHHIIYEEYPCHHRCGRVQDLRCYHPPCQCYRDVFANGPAANFEELSRLA